MTPFLKAIQRAGHELLVATSGPMVPALRRFGFSAVGVGPSWRQDGAAGECDFSRYELARGRGPFLARVAAASVDDLAAAGREWRPNVILRDNTCYAGWIASELLGVPQASWAITLRVPGPMLHVTAGEILDAALEHYGLPPDPDLLRLDGSLYFDTFPPGFQPLWWPRSPVAVAVRPEPFDGVDVSLPAWVTGRRRRPLVHATLGTVGYYVGDLFEKLIEALAGRKVDALVTVGRHRNPSTFTRLPRNVRVEAFVSHRLLFPHCSAVISHAGPGIVLKALAAGLPQLLLPLAADQPANAWCCEQLGLGLSAATNRLHGSFFPVVEPDAVTAAQLGELLDRLLDDLSFRERAAEMRERIQEMPPASAAVALLEECAVAGA